MADLSTNLERLSDARDDIAESIRGKGVTVGEYDGFEDFSSKIDSITNSYSASDEGKVVNNGELISQTTTTKTKNGTYNTTTIRQVKVNVPTYSASDNGKVIQNGALSSQTAYGTVTSNGTIDTTYNNSVTVNVPPSVNYSFGSNTVKCKPCVKYITVPRIWTTVSITGISYSSFYSENVWTDGDNIYYSDGYSHYVFDKSTLTWTSKSWSGLSSFYGYNIWTDGIDIYYSTSSGHYVLNKSTSTWSHKNWNGIPLYSGTPNFSGNNVWTDDTNIYMSNSAYQYKLTKGTENWTQTSWTMPVEGNRIWTNGEYIYGVTGNGYYYIYDKSGNRIGNMRYSGISNFSVAGVWSDGNSIYYSSGSFYILSFDGPDPGFIEATAISYSSGFVPNNIWSDGENIYSSVSHKLNTYTTEVISVSSNTHAPSART